MRVEEEMFEKVFGQSVEETLRETSEQGDFARERKAEAVPGKKEVEEHNLDHGVFRMWCPQCVKGRAESYGHVRKVQIEGDVPTIGLDYMYMHSEQEKEEEKGMPIVLAKDSKTKMIMARVVPGKGVDSYAVETVKKMVERLGHKKIIMKSDNAPAILALKEAVRRESDVEIVMEEVPAGDHQANGLAENAVENVQDQFRVIKNALESRHGRRVDGEHPVVPWMVMHAAKVVNRSRKDDEGFSAYRRWKGRERVRETSS